MIAITIVRLKIDLPDPNLFYKVLNAGLKFYLKKFENKLKKKMKSFKYQKDMILKLFDIF